MRILKIFAALVPALAGCSSYPLQDDVTRKSTYDIVDQIRCEARRAVMENGYYYKTASIAYEFTFDITEGNNTTADATWTLPYTLGGSFSLAANAGMNRTRETTRNFKIVDTFEQLRQMPCVDQHLRKDLIYPIAGDIGVYEVVQTFIRLQKLDNPKSGEVFTFGDTLMFTTTLMGGVQPKLVLSPFTDRFRLTAADASLAVGRNDVHTVTLTLSGTPPKAAGPVIGASLRAPTVAALGAQTNPNSSLVSTTIIQSASNPTDRALLELDRQRILALQARTSNLLVGP